MLKGSDDDGSGEGRKEAGETLGGDICFDDLDVRNVYLSPNSSSCAAFPVLDRLRVTVSILKGRTGLPSK